LGDETHIGSLSILNATVVFDGKAWGVGRTQSQKTCLNQEITPVFDGKDSGVTHAIPIFFHYQKLGIFLFDDRIST